MKKRILSCLMALALCLTLLPTAALAEETEGTAQTPPAVEKAADPANGEAKQENQPAETKRENQSAEAKQENQSAEAKQESQLAEVKQENQSAEQEEQREDSAAKQAVADVQAMIDALPDAAELDGMDDAEAMEVYEAFQTACEAYYDTLSEKQQAQLKNTEKLEKLSEWFSQLETLAAGDTHTHCVCGKSVCAEDGHGDIDFNMWLASSDYNTLVVGGEGSSSETDGDGLDPVDGKYVLDGGNYYLKTGVDGFNSDVTIDHTILITGDVTICLNGQTIQSTATDKPVFEVVSGSLTLTDCKNNQGKVTRAYNKTGGGVEVNGGTFNLYGGKITGNTAANGGGVKVTGGTVNMYGGEIADNKAAGHVKGTGDGGGVYMSGGTFHMRGGSITNNKTEVYGQGEGNGGGVYVSGGEFNLYDGGSITRNKATGNASASKGGGVRVGSDEGKKGTFNMYGGEITYNEANYGGGVDVYEGTFTMSGGKIANNTTANYGGGVYVDRDFCTFIMSGGSISGNKAGSGGGVYVYSDTFTMRGGEIKDNEATGNGGGVYLNGGAAFQKGGGQFTVSGKVVIKDNKKGTANNNVYLVSEENPIIIGEGGLTDGASIGVTTKNAAAGVAIATGTGLNDGDAKKFESDLNGYAVSVNEEQTRLVLVKAHKHYLCGGDECTKNGHTCSAVTFTQWTSTNSLPNTVGDYYLDTDVTLSSTWEPVDGMVLCLNGHSITMDSVNYDAIRVFHSLTLTDCKGEGKTAYGQITHTIMPSGTHYTGGGVMVKGGEFLMFGGKITKNKTNSEMCGGGVMVNGGKFNMYGGEITDNEAYMGGGVMVSDSTTNTASGKFNMYGGSITNNTANYNKGDERGGGGGVAVDAGTFTMSGSAEITGNHAECGGGVYEGASGTFIMNSGAKIAKNEASGKGGGVYMGASGSKYKFQMTGGSITNNTAAEGGGVYAGKYSTSQFTMTGGSITNNTATNTGGGVYVTKMTFNMSGGTIARNNAENEGGGVYAGRYGTFIMNAGEITDNEATSTGGNGGGVYVGGADSKFTMSGSASITGNTAKNGGGVGVYSGATFEMNGNASITDNTATSNGGGVYEGGGKFNMSGGASISRNEATTGNGGGVYVGGGVFTMSGGSITSNHTANKANYGGGVYVDTYGTFNMSGGTIGGAAADKANKAKNGGGVYVSGGTFNMSGGSITGNDSNGVFVDDRATFTVSGAATVKGNTREGAASNVFLAGSKTITIGGKLTGSPNSIGVTRGAYLDIANNVNEDYSGIFFSDKTQYVVKYKDSQLVLAKKDTTAETHTHCLCGKTHTAIGDHQTEQEVTFATELKMENGKLMKGGSEWTKSTVNRADGGGEQTGYVLSRGEYYLYGDITLSDAAILINGDVKLCLNGHTIDRANGNAARDYVIWVLGNDKAHLTLTDCVGGGTIKGGGNGGVDIFGFCTLDMFGGTITGNTNRGVGVGQFGTFNLYGGKITGNSAGYGGGVYNGGTVNMYGGEIRGNTASNKGGGVYMEASMGNYQGGILNVSGAAKITDNTVNGTACNVYLPSGKTITIGGALTGEAGSIGVTTEPKPAAGTPVTVIADTKGITGLTIHVVSDDNAYATAVEGSAIVLKVKGDGETHTHTYDGTWKYDGTNHWQECTDANCPDRDGSVRGETAHVYDNDTDTTCNVCGYVRTGTSENIPVTGITLNTTTASLEVGKTTTLTATVEPSDATNKSVTWTSSDTSVATVAPDGTVTAVKAGAATITATAADGSGKSAACTVTVTGSSTGGNTGGSSSGGGGGSSSGGSDSNPIIKTEMKNNTDGSTTKTETRRDGSVTQTTTGKDGSVSKTETKPNGSSVTENKAADGSTGTVKTDKNGQTEAKTVLSDKAIEDAKKNGEAVKAPVEVEASRNSSTAPTVKVELPKGAGETKVEIPVSNVKPGTVAVIVHPDGTEEILKNSIPTEDGIQLTVDGSATVKIVDNSKGFIDTRNHWAEDEIDFVSARGLVNGMSDTIYAPNNSTTRAQLWTILARQNDADLTGGSIWYEKAQNWAKAKGVSDGANPNAAINRAQMVTMLWRAKGQPAAGGTAHFTDVPADAYYAGAVSWAVENGITTGVGNGRFDPTGACTRAQIAAFLTRLYAEK